MTAPDKRDFAASVPIIPLSEAQPGDIVLAHGPGIISRMIRIVQRLRAPKEYSTWNHCGILDYDPSITDHAYRMGASLDERGWLVYEAEPHGTVVGWLSEIGEYAIVSADSFPPVIGTVDRDKQLAWAKQALGTKYGFLTILSIAVNMCLPRFLDFHVNVRGHRSLICSAYAMRSLEHGGVLSPIDPFQITPAEMAETAAHYNPPPGPYTGEGMADWAEDHDLLEHINKGHN
jgi:hypothetical protein